MEKRRGLRARRIAGITVCVDEDKEESASGHIMRAMRAISDRLDTLEKTSVPVRGEAKQTQRNAKQVQCFGCGEYGHYKLFCRNDVSRCRGKDISPCYVCGELVHLARECSRRRMVLGRDKVTDAEQMQSTMKPLTRKTVSSESKSSFGEPEKKHIASCRWTQKVFSDPSSLLVSVVIGRRHGIVW